MKKILVALLISTVSFTALTGCTNKEDAKNNAPNTQKTQNQESSDNIKIKSESTQSLISTLADLMGKEDKEVVEKLGKGIPVSDPVLSRQYETNVLDENNKVYVNLDSGKVYDISILLNNNNFEEYEKKLTEIFGEKSSEEENTLDSEGNGRRATIWNLENGSKLSLIQVNKTFSINIK